MARVEIPERVARVYAGGDRERSVAALHTLVCSLVDLAAQSARRVRVTRLTRDGITRWEHRSASVLLRIECREARLSYRVELNGGDRLGVVWFDPSATPCYLTSLADRCVQDMYELLWHAGELDDSRATASWLLPPGTTGPHGERNDRTHEAELLRPRRYARANKQQRKVPGARRSDFLDERLPKVEDQADAAGQSPSPRAGTA